MATRVAQADFFSSVSSIFAGDQAYALQVSGSYQVTDGKSNDDSILTDNSGTALVPAMGLLKGAEDVSAFSQDTSVYVVRQGDNIAAIAKMFDVSVDTILWANDMKKGDKLTSGDVLLILPISGLEHTVAKGQTLQSIAKLYKVDINNIIQNNDIAENTKLAVGDTLIIPNASKSEESGTPVKDTKASTVKDNQYYKKHPVKNLAGYYVNPVPGYRKSQGIHDKNAIDMAIARGTSVYAAASGTVTLARLGYNGGFGGLVIISHPNGTETLYAHLSKLSTFTGASVSQGEVIGSSGGVPGTPYAGHSTGAHLHFEVHGARNPGTDGSWAN